MNIYKLCFVLILVVYDFFFHPIYWLFTVRVPYMTCMLNINAINFGCLCTYVIVYAIYFVCISCGTFYMLYIKHCFMCNNLYYVIFLLLLFFFSFIYGRMVVIRYNDGQGKEFRLRICNILLSNIFIVVLFFYTRI